MPVQPDDLLLVNRGGQDYKYPANDFIGPGVAESGTTGQVLAKKTNANYDTEWVNLPTPPDLSGYATKTYVDEEDGKLETRINTAETDINSNTSLINANTSALNSTASKADLATATASLPYRIETDKTVRSADLPARQSVDGVVTAYAGGEIYLTDNLGYYSNVRFEGQGNVSTSSTAQGIVVDGSALMPKNLLSLPELS